jgi:hypothetical protein
LGGFSEKQEVFKKRGLSKLCLINTYRGLRAAQRPSCVVVCIGVALLRLLQRLAGRSLTPRSPARLNYQTEPRKKGVLSEVATDLFSRGNT